MPASDALIGLRGRKDLWFCEWRAAVEDTDGTTEGKKPLGNKSDGHPPVLNANVHAPSRNGSVARNSADHQIRICMFPTGTPVFPEMSLAS